MRDDEIIVITLFFSYFLLLVPFFDIVDLQLLCLCFFLIWVFHANLGVPSFSFLFYLPLFSNKLVSKPFTFGLLYFALIMASMKYNILLLDRNTRFTLWQVKMRAILTQMDLEEALLGSNKMSSSWTVEEKQKRIIKLCLRFSFISQMTFCKMS